MQTIDSEVLSDAVGVRIVKLAEILKLDSKNHRHRKLITDLTQRLTFYVIREINSGRAKTIEEALNYK